MFSVSWLYRMCPVRSLVKHVAATTENAASPKQSGKMSVSALICISMQESCSLRWRQEVLISSVKFLKFLLPFGSKDTGHLNKLFSLTNKNLKLSQIHKSKAWFQRKGKD